MKAGRVVHIRVSPKDCMSCIDVVRKAGYITDGMSFAQAVSTALNVMLNSVRDAKIIPTRDGFEYSEMMRPFEDQPFMRKRKLDLTEVYERARMPIEPAESPFESDTNSAVSRLERRAAELAALQQADPLNDRSEELLQVNQQLAAELAKERK